MISFNQKTEEFCRGFVAGCEATRGPKEDFTADWAMDFYAKDTAASGPVTYGAEPTTAYPASYKERALDALLEIAEDCGVKPSDRVAAATALFYAATT